MIKNEEVLSSRGGFATDYTTNYEAKTDDYETSANPLFAQEVSEVEFLQGFEEVLPWNK